MDQLPHVTPNPTCYMQRSYSTSTTRSCNVNKRKAERWNVKKAKLTATL